MTEDGRGPDGGGGTSCTVINTREPSGDVCGPETVAACNSSAAVWEATAAGMFDVGTQLAAGPDAMGAVMGGKCASGHPPPTVGRRTTRAAVRPIYAYLLRYAYYR